MKWIFEYSPIFFDFDGLLVNTEHLHYRAYQKLLENHNVLFPWDFPTFSGVAHKSAIGLQKMIQSYVPKLFEKYSWDELYEEKKQAYITLVKEGGVKLMPGVEKILEAIQRAQIPHGVVTNSTLNQVDLIIEQLPLLKTIPYWITRENYKSPKPSPDPYLIAIQMIGASDKMLGFEDALKGIQALEQATITPVLVCASDHPQMAEVPKNLIYFPSFTDII